jgi:hypothetical protein
MAKYKSKWQLSLFYHPAAHGTLASLGACAGAIVISRNPPLPIYPPLLFSRAASSCTGNFPARYDGNKTPNPVLPDAIHSNFPI